MATFLMATIPCVVTWGKQKSESDSAIQTEIMQIEGQMKQAILRKDVDALDHVYADSMVWTARGELLTKAQVLADFRSGRLKNNSLEHSNIEIHIYRNTVVLTGYSTSQLVFGGKVLNTPRRFSDAFVKLDGRWQLVAHAVTNIESD